MKVGVVLRKLSGHETSVSAVIEDPQDPEIDNLQGYFESRMRDHVDEFCKMFPEFRTADFRLQILETM